MEKLCKNLRDQAMKLINHKKMKEIMLTNEERESYEKQKNCYICEKEFLLIKIIKKNLNHIVKSEIIVIIRENLEELPIVVVI